MTGAGSRERKSSRVMFNAMQQVKRLQHEVMQVEARAVLHVSLESFTRVRNAANTAMMVSCV